MAVIRKTYGFNKKDDDIGLSQLAEMTGIAKAHVSVAIRDLVSRRILSREQGKFGHRLGINKNYRLWIGVTKTVTPGPRIETPEGVTESVTPEQSSPGHTDVPRVTDSVTLETPVRGSQIGNPPVTKSVTPPVTKSVTTKDNPSKDNYQKTNIFPRSLRERFEIFWKQYPRKTEKQDALKAFTKINPDDDLLETMLAAVAIARRSEQWKNKRFIKHGSVWLNKACWQDELVVDYTPTQVAVIEAFNASLGDRLGRIDSTLFLENRASLIDDFLTFHRKDPDFWKRYFAWVADRVDVPPRCGFDWLIGRDGFTKVKGGQFTRETV
jgi:hypothetical protein